MKNKIRLCKKCSFILGTRPGLKENNGVCLACINSEKKKEINFTERQEWLTQYISQNRTNDKYDCVIAVSGGKDSHMIISRLMKKHGVKTPLLVSVADEFTMTKAGAHNRKNLGDVFGVDHISFRCNPQKFKKQTLEGFEQHLNPLDWLEKHLSNLPFQIAKAYGIRLVFLGENSAFDYGSSTDLDIFSPDSDDETKILYLGAIYPYSITDSLRIAREHGFKDLDDFNEWPRQGSIENYTQIDSIGYLVHIWCKFPKFGFQRVSDIACRLLREGFFTKEQTEKLIKERDYILDPTAKRDFCQTLEISEQYFDKIVDKHANKDLVHKDINGLYKRNDYDKRQN